MLIHHFVVSVHNSHTLRLALCSWGAGQSHGFFLAEEGTPRMHNILTIHPRAMGRGTFFSTRSNSVLVLEFVIIGVTCYIAGFAS